MPDSPLPERASLEYLKKLAKERLRELRRAEPNATLAQALLRVARDHGFSSWRRLKAAVDEREHRNIISFFDACATDDADRLRALLGNRRQLARVSDPRVRHAGWTGLHTAAKGGHTAAVRALLEHGADPNAREAGDNTYPLHWAAAHGHVETARALLDAGADVHGTGDAHELDVIGWATFYRAPGADPATLDPTRLPLVSLLVERGAGHHIFSAMSVGDLDLIRNVVEQDPEVLDRRLSRFEKGQTPLHYAIHRKRYDILDLLIDLGADLEAEDGSGQTALAAAMLCGDHEAVRRLHQAGAVVPTTTAPADFRSNMAALAGTVTKGVPMIYVPDVARALDWYTSIGFREVARYEDNGLVNFGMVSFGGAELMLNMHGKAGPHDVSLWFYTDDVDRLYQQLKARQLDAARAGLWSGASAPLDGGGERINGQEIMFEQDIEDMFYGARQFSIRDLNGYELYFIQTR
jgi:ankyrin repeat protein/catechol 2,3-dioxygenase-like lactoylglutathione lyase family enzyme